MQKLSQIALAKKLEVIRADYAREEIQPGIVHFGVGNFHRCHQAVYVDNLLQQGHTEWGIVGVSLRSSNIRDSLAPQDFLYTEVTLGQETEFRVIGSILDILVAPQSPAAVISQVADGQIKLVTTTITEKGYYLTSGQIDFDHPDIAADRTSLKQPTTIYGYLAAALITRHKANEKPLSVLCCDNVQAGGEHLHAGVRMLLQEHNEDALSWMEEHVSFASSMVDRVSPATGEPLKQLVRESIELDDAWPVSAEPYTQWIIEDNFAGPRPPFDAVGAVFTQSITHYEQMKLRFLNAGHSIISVLGYLAGHTTIHGALENENILNFALEALHENALPVATLPENCKGEDYIRDVMARFKNSALPYTVQQVNTDSSQKIQQRWFPTIDEALAQGGDTGHFSFILAAWIVAIQRALETGELNDPLLAEFSTANQKRLLAPVQKPDQEHHELIHQFLNIAGAVQFSFINSEPFMTSVSDNYNALLRTQSSTDLYSLLSRFSTQKKEATHA